MAVDDVTLRELIDIVSDETGVKRGDVKEVVDCLFRNIMEELSQGTEVKLSPYVSFKFLYRPGKRKGTPVRNPSTGETRPLEKATPAKFVVRARPLSKIRASTPTPQSKGGKAIIAAYKERQAARAA